MFYNPLLRPGCSLTLVLLLAACGSAPPADISLATPASTAVAGSQIGDLKIERISWSASKPGCAGDCPRIEIDSIAFPGIPKLTMLIDRALADMTGIDQNLHGSYETLRQYTPYFWQTAQPRDATYFKASVKDLVGDVISIELHSTQYLTGAAHGIPATQYINWQRSKARILALDEVLIPGRRAELTAALSSAHQQWLAHNEDAQRDPTAYQRMWPFQDNNNFALTRAGLTFKYSAYSIAPYSHGEPELSIPYSALRGIVRPEFLPAS